MVQFGGSTNNRRQHWGTFLQSACCLKRIMVCPLAAPFTAKCLYTTLYTIDIVPKCVMRIPRTRVEVLKTTTKNALVSSVLWQIVGYRCEPLAGEPRQTVTLFKYIPTAGGRMIWGTVTRVSLWGALHGLGCMGSRRLPFMNGLRKNKIQISHDGGSQLKSEG